VRHDKHTEAHGAAQGKNRVRSLLQLRVYCSTQKTIDRAAHTVRLSPPRAHRSTQTHSDRVLADRLLRLRASGGARQADLPSNVG